MHDHGIPSEVLVGYDIRIAQSPATASTVDPDRWWRPDSVIDFCENTFTMSGMLDTLHQVEELRSNLGSVPHVIVAITVSTTAWTDRESKAWFSIWHNPNNPSSRPPLIPLPETIRATSTLLGYDVADRWLTSAIHNCDEVVEIDRLGASFTDHHLIATDVDAFAIAQVANASIADHAPFFVYGVWKLR